MNKAELIEIVASKADTTKTVANALLEALVYTITQAVAEAKK